LTANPDISKIFITNTHKLFSTQAIAQEQGEAELSGEVVDAITQEAISGAQVILQGEDKEVTTGEDGSFAFESLIPLPPQRKGTKTGSKK
jgi:hypothetical protein